MLIIVRPKVQKPNFNLIIWNGGNCYSNDFIDWWIIETCWINLVIIIILFYLLSAKIQWVYASFTDSWNKACTVMYKSLLLVSNHTILVQIMWDLTCHNTTELHCNEINTQTYQIQRFFNSHFLHEAKMSIPCMRMNERKKCA